MRGHVVGFVALAMAAVSVTGCGGSGAAAAHRASSSTTTTDTAVGAPSPSTTAAPVTSVAPATAAPTTAPPPSPTSAPVPSPTTTRTAPTTAAPPATAPAGPRAVTIRDYVYAPDPVQVRAGSSVTWTNRDGAPHTATAADHRWDTGSIANGQSATVRFDTPGTYAYTCSLHPTMRGQVVVVA